MGTMEINAKVRELKELEALQKEISAEVDEIKEQLKAEMKRRNTDEMSVGVFTVRYKTVKSKRLDTQALRASRRDIYAMFLKETTSTRFTVS